MTRLQSARRRRAARQGTTALDNPRCGSHTNTHGRSGAGAQPRPSRAATASRRLATLAATTLLAAVSGIAAPAHAEANDLTTANVREFIDSRLPELMEEQGIPGAAVSVVADGEEVFAGGYGYADLDSEEPVAADRHAFLTGSVGKSFTAAALLQLVDAGEVDLDADVNTYLPEDAQVADTYPGDPVTAHHLLTHTAGFEETRAGTAAADPADALPLSEYLAERQPDRAYPPGRYTAYSNYGLTLAGYIVEEVSGQPFVEYVEEHLFAPLGMADSAFAQSQREVSGELDTTTRYTLGEDGELTPAPDVGGHEYPAGFSYTTAPDMSRFMLAQLGEGEYDGERVLRPETARSMLTRQAEMHPDIAGVGYGTYERYSAEPQVFGHYGDFLGANAEYALVPERDAGIFIAVNSDSAEDFQDWAWHVLVDEFLAEFLDVEAGVGFTQPVQPQVPLEAYAGGYHAGRVSYSEFTMLPTILGSYRPASVEDGGLRMSCSTAQEEQHWVPVGDGLFHAKDGSEWVGFIEDNGEIVGLICDKAPTHPYVRVEWHQTPFPYLITAGAALLVLLSMLAWPTAALARRLRGRPRGARAADRAASRGARGARLLAGLTGILCAAAPAVLVNLFNSDEMPFLAFTGSPLPTLPLAAVVPPAAGVAAAAVLAWRRGWWGVPGRAHYSAVSLALIAFLAVAHHFNFVWTPWT